MRDQANERAHNRNELIQAVSMDQSHNAYGIQVTMQSCLDAGAPPDLLRQIVAMYRRHYAGDKQLQTIIDDVEVRYIKSLEGYTP